MKKSFFIRLLIWVLSTFSRRGRRDTYCKAFTLIELLVVVLIIGILAAVAVPQYRFAVEKARATEAIMAVQTWASALERYRLANGSYPETESSAKSDIDITLPASKQFSQYYYHSPGLIYIAYKGDNYTISKVLPPATSYKEWLKRGLTCNTGAVGTTDDFGAKVCKALCGTSNLIVVWGSGQYGCSIKY